MAKESLDRKALKRDAFRDLMWEWVGRLYKYRVWAIFAAVGLLVILLAAGGVLYRNQVVAGERATAFYLAEKAYHSQTGPEKDRLQQARKAFQDFVRHHPGANLTPFAEMFLAKIAWQEKDLDAALSHFEKARGHGEALAVTRHLAGIGVARVHEMRGEFEAAEAIYRALPEDPFADLKVLSLGRLAVARSQPAQAREQLKELAKRFPPDRLSSWAEETLSGLP